MRRSINPSLWSEFVGLDRIVSEMKLQVRQACRPRAGNVAPPVNVFISGQTGSAKSAITSYLGKCCMCLDLDPETLDACGICHNCIDDGIQTYGNMSMVPDGTYFFHRINCDSADLNKEIPKIVGTLRPAIIHLEEAGFLLHGEKYLKILTAMDQLDAIWIATAISTNGFSEQFLRRFEIRLTTKLPSERDIALWVNKQCGIHGIEIGPNTAEFIAEHCGDTLSPAVNLINIMRRHDRPRLTDTVAGEYFGIYLTN